VIGLLYIVAGFSVFENPMLAAKFFTLLLGIGLAAAGIIRAVLTFHLPVDTPRVLVFFSGVLSFAIGAYILIPLP